MLRRTCGVALLVLAGLAGTAQAQTTLEWKFKPGEKYYVEDVVQAKQTLSVIGKDLRQTTKMTTQSTYTVTKVADGEVTMEMKLDSIDVKATGDGLGSQIDKFFEKLQDVTFTATLKNGKVNKLVGYEEFIKKLAEDNEDTAKFAKELFTQDLIKKAIEQAFGNDRLPGKAVKTGDTWSKETTEPFGPLGTFKFNNTYNFKSKESDGAFVEYKGTMSYSPPKNETILGGLAKITKGNLKSNNVKGSYVFSDDKGRLVQISQTWVVRGSLTLEVMGNPLDVDCTVDQATTTRISTTPFKTKSN
jgi:hypothetical protein